MLASRCLDRLNHGGSGFMLGLGLASVFGLGLELVSIRFGFRFRVQALYFRLLCWSIILGYIS